MERGTDAQLLILSLLSKAECSSSGLRRTVLLITVLKWAEGASRALMYLRNEQEEGVTSSPAEGKRPIEASY